MFLMFTLHRPDVLATGDVGIRNAVMRAYGLARRPTAALTELASRGGPYRTRACRYLWRSLENTPD
jgi:DNA-3-methyladenine glycosylase II